MPGVAPKPASKRRRRNVPASYGAAEPVTAPAAPSHDRELGIDNPHPLIVDMWDAVQTSAEARFYSEADWVRLRLELSNASRVMQTARGVADRVADRPAQPERHADQPVRQAPGRDRTTGGGPGSRRERRGVDDLHVQVEAEAGRLAVTALGDKGSRSPIAETDWGAA